MKRSSSPTMRTVAELAGVSLMTVSRALKNHPGLAPATCQRVQRIARKIGYRPNPLVSTLMSQLRRSRTIKHTPTLLFLTAFPHRSAWRASQFHMESALHGATRRCEQLGFRLEEFWLAEPGLTPERIQRIFYTRAIAGLIVAPLPEPPVSIPVQWEGFASAAIAYSMTAPVLHRACNDHHTTIRIALRNLRAAGYQRIGLALPLLSDNRVDNRWSAGFLAHEPGRPADRVPPLLPLEWNEKIFSAWFAKHRPDAIISLGFAMNIQQWVRARGMRIPDDVGLAFLDLNHENDGSSGIHQNAELIGAASVDLVVEQINRNERGVPPNPKVIMIEGEWKQGSTTRPPAREGYG